MTRVVGVKDRSELILDPAEAWRRGRALDRLLAGATIPHRRGVLRARHAVFNAIDDARQLAHARRVSAAPTLVGGPAA